MLLDLVDRRVLVAHVGGAQVHGGEGLWRVRFGPYPTRQAAQAGVRAAAAQGLANMPIMANDER